MTVVNGEGPATARGMIVGEAPGREEVAAGRPFVGPSGLLLNDALRMYGIDRESVFVTNACRTLPVDDDGKLRPPTDDELVRWHADLLCDISYVRPHAILMLGRSAQWSIHRTRTMPWGRAALVEWSRGHTIALVPAWHPAYVLRQGVVPMPAILPPAPLGSLPEAYEEWLRQFTVWADIVHGA